MDAMVDRVLVDMATALDAITAAITARATVFSSAEVAGFLSFGARLLGLEETDDLGGLGHIRGRGLGEFVFGDQPVLHEADGRGVSGGDEAGDEEHLDEHVCSLVRARKTRRLRN